MRQPSLHLSGRRVKTRTASTTAWTSHIARCLTVIPALRVSQSAKGRSPAASVDGGAMSRYLVKSPESRPHRLIRGVSVTSPTDSLWQWKSAGSRPNRHPSGDSGVSAAGSA